MYSLSIYSFINSFICLFIHLFIYSFIRLSIIHTIPSSYSTAIHLSHIKKYLFLVWMSWTCILLKNQDGLFPLLSCQILKQYQKQYVKHQYQNKGEIQKITNRITSFACEWNNGSATAITINYITTIFYHDYNPIHDCHKWKNTDEKTHQLIIQSINLPIN